MWNGWPVWSAPFLFSGVIGLGLLGKFCWKLFIGWRTRSRVAQPIEKQEPAIRAESALKIKWREGISLLRRSSLRRFGNPLYVLPWYMVIGSSGSGKTTALTRARLSSPLKKVSAGAAIEQTQNVEWWFFENSVVLDTTGRYVASEGIGADSKEWDKMLDLLGRHRAKEGLNGLVLTVQADRLLDPDHDKLAEEGRVIRKKIEQMTRLFDKRFPIYVLVTKCDRLYGMETWSHLLPEGMLERAMGYVGDQAMQGRLDEAAFIDTAFDHVGEQLKQMRLVIMQRLDNADPGILLFPHEIERLQAALKGFLHHALGDSPYLENPFLRGLFFSSGLQQGGAVSPIVDNIAPSEAAHESSHKGMFLHDVFDRILPADRYLLHPADLVNPWRRATRHLGLAAWLFLIMACAGYLSFSFVHNFNALNYIRAANPGELVLIGQLKHDVEALDRFRSFAHWLERRDSRFSSRFLVFNRKIAEIEAHIKASYVLKFYTYVFPALDEAFDNERHLLASGKQPANLAGYIKTLVRRINLSQARINGARHDDLRKMPPVSGSILFEKEPDISLEAARHFNDMYVAALGWTTNDRFLSERLNSLRNELNQVAIHNGDMQWIISWANAQPDLKRVRLGDFWQGTQVVLDAPEISSAFTRKGKERIDAFLAEVRRSETNPARFDKNLRDFTAWYAAEKARVWRDFAWDFSRGEETLSGKNEWRAAVVSVSENKDPYSLLMTRLENEFEDIAPDHRPAWLNLNQRLLDSRISATKPSSVEGVAVLNDMGGNLLREIAAGGSIGQVKAELNVQLMATSSYRAYHTALMAAVSNISVGAAQAAQTAADFHNFDVDPTVKSTLRDAYARQADLRHIMGTVHSEEQAIWGLLAGPLQLAVRYANTQASCMLQRQWDAMVVRPTRSASGTVELFEKLYGDQGSVWAFVNGSAKPYVRYSANLYLAAETLGQTFPFTADFLPFLNTAISDQVARNLAKKQLINAEKRVELDKEQRKQTLQAQIQQTETRLVELTTAVDTFKQTVYPITVTGLPTSVNDGAQANVLSTTLRVQCAGAPFNIANLNFSVSESFGWSQSTCGETTLRIKLPAFTLIKKYPGPQGFVAFLRDFQTGEHVFDSAAFPLDSAKLDAVNVKRITVRYQFSGEAALLSGALQLVQIEEERSSVLKQKEANAAQVALDQQQSFAGHSNVLGGMAPAATIQLPTRIGQCWNTEGEAGRLLDSIAKPTNNLEADALAILKPAAVSQPVKSTTTAVGSRRLQPGALPKSATHLNSVLDETEHWLAVDGQYALQIWLADTPESAESALKRWHMQANAQAALAYPTFAKGKRVWAIALTGYDSAEQAAKARLQLDALLQAQGPRIRTSQGIRQELIGYRLYRE